jgi:serine/threonine protein kinase
VLKIASAVEIGPKLEPYFGFDLLMFPNCVQFAMETCESLYNHNVNGNLLLWNMALLHWLHIVHRDIKPDNVMLSPSFRKPVFIDFGLSIIITENIGSTSLTHFTGSINFCS